MQPERLSNPKAMNVSTEKIRGYAYSQAKQVLKLSLRQIHSPYIASFLAIIYKEAKDYEVIEKLRLWLYEYISPYIFSDPRDQTDLREKTLAIATYIYVEDTNHNTHQLPSEFIQKYIDYASKQDWDNDTFLAFICGLSSAKYTTCELGANFLKDRLLSFCSEKNIAAICQSIFLLNDFNNNEAAATCLNMVKEYISSTPIQTFEYSWSLLALSKSTNDDDHSLLYSLRKQLEEKIEIITDPVLSQAYSEKYEQLALKHDELRSNRDTLHKTDVANDSEEFNENIGSTDEANIDWDELGLITACLCLSNSSYFLSLSGYSENKIAKILSDARKAEKGGVIISKQANLVGNIISLLITVIFGLGMGMYLFGIKLISENIQVTTKPDLGDLLFIFVWGDYLFSQLQALFHGESALEGMIRIPLIRHIGTLLHNKKGA